MYIHELHTCNAWNFLRSKKEELFQGGILGRATKEKFKQNALLVSG